MWKKMFMVLITIALFTTQVNAAELRLFSTDYDNEVYITASVELDVAEEVPKNWYPLRAMSEILPFDVQWDMATKEIVVSYEDIYDGYIEDRYTTKEIEKHNKLMLIDQTTYCSPDFLMEITKGMSFWYDDAFYHYVGEAVISELIRDNGSEKFRGYVNTSMYELYLKFPEDYEYIREHLDGGIERSTKSRTGRWKRVLGYTYARRNPSVCYVLAKLNSAKLTSLIGHEATHIYQARNGLVVNEELPNKYDRDLYERIVESNEVWKIE